MPWLVRLLKRWRWAVFVVGLAVLVSLPALIAALPAGAQTISASTLLQRVKGADNVDYSGDAVSTGGIVLPVTTSFSDLTDLFGSTTHLRVWWRGTSDWRVDTITPVGETDVHGDAAGTWTWDYQKNSAVRSETAQVRLPRVADVDPAQLGRRLLSEANADEVHLLPARRIAGRDAAGLRLTPADSNSTIDRVDIYVDVPTGLPVSVAVYGAGASRPAMQTAYLALTTKTPSAATVAFTPPRGAKTRFERVTDLADGANRYVPLRPAAELAGYPLRTRVEGLGAVGTYGRGVTVLSAVPLPSRYSGSLRSQIAVVPGVTQVSQGDLLQVGPLSLLLTADHNGGAWLLGGTVTAATLQRAAGGLPAQGGPRR